MVQIAISITKTTLFRGVQQEFSNVYHYRAPGPGPVQNPKALVDEIVAIEKDLHSTAVTFKNYAVWTSGGDKQQNKMVEQGPLSGVGNRTDVAGLDRERAFLMQWPAGLSTTGKPVFLRKWFHSCGWITGTAGSNALLANTGGFTDAERDAMSTRPNDLRIIGPVDEWLLVSEKGREHVGPGRIHKYLEHHQLGDMWR